MKIVLFLNERIIKYSLPKQVFGTFSFDEKDDSETKLINIEAKNGQWYINSIAGVRVLNDGNYQESIKLERNQFYTLERESQKYLIYIENIFDNTFVKYKCDDKLNLIVGKDKNCNVYYDCKYLKDKPFSIRYNQNQLILQKESDEIIYINKNILYSNVNNYVIKYGDVIEIYGLRIIILKNIILINNPGKRVFINTILANLYDLNIAQSNYIDREIKDVSLYSDNDYFSKSPRIRRIIETKEIKIDAPPSVKDNDDIPLIYTLGPMLTMGMTSVVSLTNALIKITSGEASMVQQWPTLVTSSAMLLSTLLWPTLTKRYNKKEQERQKKENIIKYRKYLEEKKKEISEEANLQREILLENLISNDECYNIIKSRNINLWGRRIEQSDFLTVRIGKGNFPLDVKISYPEDGFSIDEDYLKKEAESIAKEFEILENVPIGYSFLKNTITAVMGNSYKVSKFIDNVILQLITFHSYEDLKIVIFTTSNKESEWQYLKYSQHTFDNSKQFRFFSTNNEEAKEVSNYLEQELNYRRYDADMNEIKREYTECRPYYLIITDNYSRLRRIGIMKSLTEIDNNYGFSLIILENKLSKLPSKCNNFISIGDKNSGVLLNAYEKQESIPFTDEVNYNIDMNDACDCLANIPIEFEKDMKMLPNTISFLEMENVGKVEQLNILNRWKINDPTKSLKAEVGVDENGDLMYLDLHEKYHGPHGLIAGMTGSGKSEFIISYVLSMAVNYSPNEVAFILIDYKGGGLAGAFENKNTGIKLPHLAGTITNLDKAEMDRTLVSIDSEVRRRQAIFNEARDKLGESTIDIYKYQRFFREGKLESPVPHLIIVCDEFAELKSQQPEFMDNLISIARIGRSLGVHLILATQKPSGVVNDQIWSNTKFRVCLKVQEKADSQEMLKRPEAAELKQVGRFYLQVGYNEYFALGQSAWCGAKYFPSDTVVKNIDKSINFINNFGYSIKSIQGAKKRGPAQGEELANILKYIISAAKIDHVEAKRLWLDNIPDIILADDLIAKYNINFSKFIVDAIIGEYDDPNNQNQGLLKINLNKDGNMIIYGVQGSDREMLLDSIIYSTSTRHGVDEINYYIIDYGSEALRKFYNFPHVGDMVFASEEEKLNNLFKMIRDIIKERKKIFSEYGGEYNNYIKNSGNTLPLIGVVINNYDSFIESNSLIEDLLIQYCRDGQRYGIFFIITANSDGSIRRKIKQSFNTIISLRLNDITDYSSIYGKVKNPPKDILGRGLFKSEDIYEFQTASIIDNDDLNNFIIKVGNKLKEINTTVAKQIPTLPKNVTLDYVARYLKGINEVPIGVSKSSLEVINYNFTNYITTMILSTTSENTRNFSKALLLELARINNIQLILIDSNNEIPELKQIIKYYYNSEFKKVMDMLIEYAKKVKESNNQSIRHIIFFQNLNKFKMKIEAAKLEEFTKEIKELENFNIIIADDYKKIKKSEYDGWYRNIQSDTDGIWIGSGLSDQNLFKLSKITKEMGALYKNNFGFVIRDGRAELIKLIELEQIKGGDNDE